MAMARVRMRQPSVGSAVEVRGEGGVWNRAPSVGKSAMRWSCRGSVGPWAARRAPAAMTMVSSRSRRGRKGTNFASIMARKRAVRARIGAAGRRSAVFRPSEGVRCSCA